MSGNPNLDQLKSAFATWNESNGAVSPWLDLFDDEVCICSMDETSAGLSFAEDRRSKEQAVGYFDSLLRDWQMVHWTPETYICDGDKIAMFGRCPWTYKATGKTAEVRAAHLWQFRGDKVIQFTEVFDSGRAAAAATP